MDPSYWHDKWKRGEIAFHRQAVNPALTRWFPRLKPGKVIVPLCGKSKDLLWLHEQGHAVVGIELSRTACEAFFAESGIAFTKREEGAVTVFASKGLELWCGNFFDIPPQAWEGGTAVYDRAALVALPSELRARYAKTILERLPRDFQEMLLIAVEYSNTVEERPPFSVMREELARLYGAKMNIQSLDNGVDPDLTLRRGYEVREAVYSLRWQTF